MRPYALVLALGLASCSAAATSPMISPQSDAQQSIIPRVQSAMTNQSAAPTLHAFTAGTTPGFLSSAAAWDVAPGAGGSMWFTDPGTPAIGTITETGTVHEYTGLPLYSKPYSIVSDGNGDAWFTDGGTASVGRITAGGSIKEFTDPKLANTYPSDITIDRSNTVWFIATGPRSVLGEISPSGKLTTQYVASDLSPDGSLIADNSGNLWFFAMNNANFRTAMVEHRADGTVTRYFTKMQPGFEPCCPNLAPKRLAIGPDGNVWFTTLNEVVINSPANWIGNFTPTGSESLRWVRSGSIHYPAYPSGITSANGLLWFTGDDPFQLNGGLWSMTTSGTMTAYPISYNPVGIVAGKQNHLWFTSHFGGQPSQIVEVTLP